VLAMIYLLWIITSSLIITFVIIETSLYRVIRVIDIAVTALCLKKQSDRFLTRKLPAVLPFRCSCERVSPL
jgi:hypothetical protein